MVSPLQVAYAALAGGPTYNWPYDDATGTTIAAIDGSNGTWTAGPSLHAQAPLLSGASSCVGIDAGTKGEINADTTGGDVTFCWVSRDDRNDLIRHQWSSIHTGGVIRGTFSPGGEFYGTSGKWTYAEFDGAWTRVVDSSVDIDDLPHFWSVVHDTGAGEIRLYQDGVLVGTYTGTVPAFSGGGDLIYIGPYWDGGSGTFVGAESDFAIWNGFAADDTDIATLATAAGDSGGGIDPPPEGQYSSVSWG